MIIKIASLDPAYTHDGDRCPAMILAFGKVGGRPTLAHVKTKDLREDVTLTSMTRDFQIAKQFKDFALSEQVSPERAGLDSTGAGKPFLSIVQELWSPRVRGVEFGGKASSLPVFSHDPRPAHKFYTNRVTELWFVGREFMRAGQLKGITPDIARQLLARQYKDVKGETVRTQAESKKELKGRIGFSPDEADCFLVGLNLARELFGFVADTGKQSFASLRKTFRGRALEADKVNHNLYGVTT